MLFRSGNTDVKTKFDVIVATNGFSLCMPTKRTDGVITVESQITWTPSTAKIHSINANHHEILLHEQTTSIIGGIIGDER